MTETIARSYDELPYESHFNPLSHPDRLASMAVLFGLEAPPVECCRVLELGCASGGNLIACAQSLPQSAFLGIDLSPRQIADGQEAVKGLGLANVTLRAMSLTDVDDGFGEFDYIVCHGVYSWVPEAVQAKILEVTARRLAPGGVAFLSYNVYPGWHQRNVVRAAMGYHTRQLTNPLERVREARQFLDFLIASTVPPNTPYALALKQEADLLKKVSDTYLFHEHLEDENRPVYFHEFVARAGRAGLKYLGPASFSLLQASLPPQVNEALGRFADDRIGREQYLDFVLNRAFRQSLLCHEAAAVRPDPSLEAAPTLYFSSMARPESSTPDVVSEAPEPFHTMSDDHVTVNVPRVKAMLVALDDRWPLSAGFEELRLESLARLGQVDDGTGVESDRLAFAEFVLQGVTSTLIQPHVHEPPIAAEPGERPRVTPLARRRAGSGAKVVNLRNGFAALRDLDRLIVPMLDGSRDRDAMVTDLVNKALRGEIHLRRDGQSIDNSDELRALLDGQVEATLNRLVGEALLLRPVDRQHGD